MKTSFRLLVALSFFTLLYSGELNFVASVDRTSVGLGETFTLNVSVSGENIRDVPSPKLPELPEFNILGRSSSQSTSISFINGKMSQQTTINFIYTLSPKKVGKFTIAPCRINYQGKDYETQPIEIEVVKGTGQKPPAVSQRPPPPAQKMGDDIILLALPDRQEIYQGEQIKVDFYLYTRYDLENINLTKSPDFKGFWAETVFEPKRLSYKRVVHKGKAYYAALLRSVALFPIKSGRLEIEPMGLSVTIIQPPRDFFDFFGTTRTIEIESKPITINALPLPLENRPEEFCGGVGRFNISAKIDRDTSHQQEPVNLIVKVSGTGNIRFIEKPKLQPLPNLKILEPEIKENIQTSGGTVRGTKEFRFPIIPQADGAHIVPEIKIAYFDPKDRTYKTLKTEQFKFVATGTSPGRVVTDASGMKILGSDIFYIKPDSKKLEVQESRVPIWFVAFYIASFALIGVAFGYQSHRKRLLVDRAYARKIRSYPYLQKKFKEIEDYLKKKDMKNYYSALSRTIFNYIGDRYNLDTGALTREQLRDELLKMKIPEQTILQLFEILNECDIAAYAPGAISQPEPNEFFKRVKEIVNKL